MSQNSWNAEFNNAKGSLLVGNNIRPIVRTVGTDGQVLMADSAQADGVAWSTVVNIQAAEILLTSLQVKSLNATPIVFIPAPGANKVILIFSCIARMNYAGTSAFIAGVGQQINLVYGNPFTKTAVTPCLDNGALTDVADSSTWSPLGTFSSTLNADIYNKDIFAKNPDPTEISGNAADDNTVSIKCLYYVFTIP